MLGFQWCDPQQDPDPEQRKEPIGQGKARRWRGQPERFHGDWVCAMPLRGHRSLTGRSICHAASGGSQPREEDQSEEGRRTGDRVCPSPGAVSADGRKGPSARQQIHRSAFEGQRSERHVSRRHCPASAANVPSVSADLDVGTLTNHRTTMVTIPALN